METRKDPLLDLLAAPSTQYVIPAYQRAYSWGPQQCRELWLDAERAAKAAASHFVGTLLYAREADDPQGFHRRAVIDGQQRLTTLTLLLAALARHLEAQHAALPDADAEAIAARYLRLGADAGSPARLVLSRNDRDTLLAS